MVHFKRKLYEFKYKLYWNSWRSWWWLKGWCSSRWDRWWNLWWVTGWIQRWIKGWHWCWRDTRLIRCRTSWFWRWRIHNWLWRGCDETLMLSTDGSRLGDDTGSWSLKHEEALGLLSMIVTRNKQDLLWSLTWDTCPDSKGRRARILHYRHVCHHIDFHKTMTWIYR